MDQADVREGNVMAKDRPPRRVSSSPYSRTGLFPWGNTYELPAKADGPWFITRTPCHLRGVRVASERGSARHTTRCGACGRAWTLHINTEKTPPTAIWTA